MKHTKGPWIESTYFDIHGENRRSVWQAEDQAIQICELPIQTPDADLIVAAPEMYDLLNNLSKHLVGRQYSSELSALVEQIDELMERLQ